MVVAVAFLIFELAAIAYAWRWGGEPERRGAIILGIMVMVTYVGYAARPHIFDAVDPIGLLVDVIGLVGFGWLGLVSRRLWPLWAASLQLLSTGAHFVRALETPERAPIYYWMKSIPTVAVILLLILGVWCHRRRHARHR